MIVSGPVTHTIHNRRENIFLHESSLTAFYNRYFGKIQRRNPPCNAEDNLHAGLLVIEARFRGY